MVEKQLLAQGLHLLGDFAHYAFLTLLYTPLFFLKNLVLPSSQPASGVVFYEGVVTHERKKPKKHAFRYNVRAAYIYLDDPPSWFSKQQHDHLTAQQAREFAGTDGPVHLLTNPMAAGYTINPISVYYCSNADAYAVSPNNPRVEKCIVEVTNTPWGERVTFVLPGDGKRHSVSKALHVSPLMDMEATWHLWLPPPDLTLKLVVRCEHPALGNFFHADLIGLRCQGSCAGARNEEAGLRTLLRYGFLPQRIAAWIYWHALLLYCKGVPLYSPPPRQVLDKATHNATHPCIASTGCPFAWRPAPGWPWDTWGTGAQSS
mmetsp:Transcript_14570/g.39446  ORF Transcript_14570/g.39446 Transcript_14570/m.39446 type:complete len:317 (-) Transcript_14570:567-1517(-)